MPLVLANLNMLQFKLKMKFDLKKILKCYIGVM